MAITVSSAAGSASVNPATSVTPSLPGSVASGDLLLIFCMSQITGETFTSSGYTDIFSETPGGGKFTVLSKTAGSSESNPTVGVASGSNSVVMVVRVSGCDTVTGPAQFTTAATSTDTASIDPPTTGSVKIGCVHTDPIASGTGSNTTWSGGATSLGEIRNVDTSYLSVAYKIEDTAGPLSYSYNEGGSALAVETLIFSIAPAAGGPSVYTKAGYAVIGDVGAGSSASLFVESGRATVGGIAAGGSVELGPRIYTKRSYAAAGTVGRGSLAWLPVGGADINQFSVGIAFTAGPLQPSPFWTYLDNVDGINVQEWTISRGRPNELEKTSTGTATVTIADLAGVFDPTNGASPHYPNVLPDRQAMLRLYDPVAGMWHTLFRGYIEEISYDVGSYHYTSGAVDKGVLFVTLNLVDAFGWLNDHELMPYTGTSAGDGDPPPSGSEGRVFYDQTPYPVTSGPVSDRIKKILFDVGWPAALTSIFSGNVTITETTYEPGHSALAALFDAADAEFPAVANLYVSKDGIITFHGRQARFRPDVAEYGIGRRDVGDPSVTGGDPTVAPISELQFSLGKTQLYNSVLVVPQDKTIGEPPTETEVAGQLLEDSASITAHGKKGLSFTDLLTLEGVATGNTALEECLLFSTYYRDNYKDPLPRITRMTFRSREPGAPHADPLWKMICRAEISDLLSVYSSHIGGGGFEDTGNQGYYIEGLRYTCRPGNTRVHDVTLEVDVSPQALFANNPFDADPDL